MNRKPHLNYKHLRYFVAVVQHGSLVAAAKALFVAPQTVSAQLLELEQQLGQPLFERIGRRLALTPAGETTRDYAQSIFALGDELTTVLSGHGSARRMSLRVGITDSVPKLLSVSVIEPVLHAARGGVELICTEGSFSTLLGQLVAHDLDALLAEYPVPTNLSRTLQGTLLMNSGMSFLAAAALAKQRGRRFPENLRAAPLLLSAGPSSTVNQALEIWLAREQINPQIVGRFADSALMKSFAQRGLGVVTVPTSIESAVMRQYNLKVIGRTDEIQQPLFLIRPRRERLHPLVAQLEQPKKSKPS